jgi:transcriptional regulator with XRE-family HTH domain
MDAGRKKKITKEFGNRLKKIRNERHMTVRELALEVEMDHPHIVNIEAGTINPTLCTIIALAEALQVDPCTLITSPK